jgi:hypothetical protein
MRSSAFLNAALQSKAPEKCFIRPFAQNVWRPFRAIMAGVKQTFFTLLVLLASCSRQPEAPSQKANAESSALDLYDVSLNTDTITIGQKVSFCFKAHNAIAVSGFPGKFQNNGALDGDCLVHAPQVDTLYRLEVTGADGSKRRQSALVKIKK